MECLNCDEQLINHIVRTTDREVNYYLCPSCESLWLPRGQLDRMADQVDGSIELSPRTDMNAEVKPNRPCPACQSGPMKSVHFLEYTNVLLDYCEHCEGFWLDEDELEEVNEELNKIMDVQEKGFADFINDIHRPYWRRRIREEDETDVDQSEKSDTDPKKFQPVRNATWISSSNMTCPACETLLERYEAFRIELEGCPNCYGMWLNDDELRQLKDRAEGKKWTDLQWVDDELEALHSSYGMPSHRPCPDCDDRNLVTVQFGRSRTHLDMCPDCEGKWLAVGVFTEIMEHLKEQVVELTPGEAANRLKHELAEVVSGPEGPLSELQDAKAAAGTLISVSLFKHPQLRDTLLSIASLFD